MKKLLFVVFTLWFSVTSFSQEKTAQFPKNLEYPKSLASDTIVKHIAYTLNWKPGYGQASWVAYELTKAETNKKFERNDRFIADTLIKTPTNFELDYGGSGYDRGHLAPAADMSWSEQTMKESFCFSNMSPQAPSFNRGIWKQLEELVRDWAIENGSIYIVTGPILSDSLKRIGVHKVVVPTYYYKVILVANSTAVKGIGFILPNEKSSESLQKFAVSIDSVEQITGLDFYYQLTDKLQSTTEKNVCLECWKWNYSESTSNSSFNSTKETSTPTKKNKSVQCSAKTKTGARCKNKTTHKSGLCSVHEKK